MIVTKYDIDPIDELYPPFYMVVREEKVVAKRIKTISSNIEKMMEEAILRMDFKPQFNINEAKERLRNGYYFICILNEKAIIGWKWTAFKEVYIEDFYCKIKIRKDHTYSYNEYTQKEYRGHGLMSIIRNEEKYNLKKDNIKVNWGLIYSWNKSSIRNSLKNGFKIIGKFYFIRFLFLTFKIYPKELK